MSTTTDTITPLHRPRWFQYRLRSLLLLTLVISIPLAWLANERQRVRQRRAGIQALLNLKCQLGLGAEKATSPLLTRLLGDDHYHSYFNGPIECLYFCPKNVGDTELVHLRSQRELYHVELIDCQVSDAGLEHMLALKKIHHLNLTGTQVSDAGLAKLKELPQLELLVLCSTKITDAGLVHIRDLKNLKHLYLNGTLVSDAGLRHLEGLPLLETLFLPDRVTEVGVRDLRKTLPKIVVLSRTHPPR